VNRATWRPLASAVARAPERTIFLRLLERHLRGAAVCFILDGDGERQWVGESGAHATFTVRVHNPSFFGRVLRGGNLGLGEAYMDGDFEVDGGALPDLLHALLRSRLDEALKGDPRLAIAIGWIRLRDVLRSDEENVQRHYDLGDDLFASFLDETLTYSCGYARAETDDLETLQWNKLDRICKKLRLAPGDRLLDIGCGYGGLLRHAAQHYGITGTGITISRRHCARARARIEQAGLGDRVRIEFADFRRERRETGTFDKVVSVGMMEHVDRRHYAAYFRAIARSLAPGGLGLVHTIGCNGPSNDHDPFIQKYIFPDSNQPRLSEITAHAEKAGLVLWDVENMIRHYGFTTRHWLERFRANRDALDASKYDARFKRMWEYYLACAWAATQASDGALYQVLFTNDRAAPMPIHRV
jgi:cyclopropane-fatty-acyl-phospholipid synthase